MHHPTLLSQHLREVYFGQNWTYVNLKDTLDGITWEQATRKLGTSHSILALTYHIQYFLRAQQQVLLGGPLDAKDALSFDHPVIEDQDSWNQFVSTIFNEAEDYAQVVADLPEETLSDTFVLDKYGSYYRNIQGMIEHTHYHLGQIVLLKRLMNSET
jgi:uncharacterized damage-inducible protein DinB